VDFVTREETGWLLACRDEEKRALLMLAVHAAAQVAEQIALSWERAAGKPPGRVSWSSTRGIVGRTKDGRERKVPLTGNLKPAWAPHHPGEDVGPGPMCPPTDRVRGKSRGNRKSSARRTKLRRIWNPPRVPG
jgi:hypothetical protein